jgi:mannosyl-oligosaccharide alpha-1,2-mannosidase
MGMHDEFENAVTAISQMSFADTSSPEINTHEINSHYLGGLLAAYDLSFNHRLLQKAIEVGDMLYAAFDTPNRMPIIHWDLHRAARQEEQIAEEAVSASELGSFILEFTRLSQITGDQKYHDAAQRVMAALKRHQDSTKLAGMWPVVLNPRTEFFDGDFYTMGAEVDSLYKSLPKAYALLGGQNPMYRKMYEKFTRTAAGHSLFRPMSAGGKDVLVPGSVRVMMTENGKPRTHLESQVHSRACSAGGMFAMGGALFNIQIHRQIAHKLVDGCVWAHNAMPLGIMPEISETIPCASQKTCPWNEWHWKQEVYKWTIKQPDPNPNLDVEKYIQEHHVPKGFISIPDTRYNLRPETVESIFVLYRVTGREDLLDIAWELFEKIQNATETSDANAAIADVTTNGEPVHNDSMGSYWMAQTLKYFYLMFSPPEVLSLDEYVFNSGGHPLKLSEHTEAFLEPQ